MDDGRLGDDSGTAEPSPAVRATLSDADLGATITTIATQEGWLTRETRDDWLIVTNGKRRIFAVMPGARCGLSTEQALGVSALLQCQKVECHVRRHDDLHRIRHTLTQRSRV